MIMMMPLILFRTAFLAFLLQANSSNTFVAAGRQIDAVASTGYTIHSEQDIDLGSLPYRTTLNVISDVPVTVERYNDNAYYLEGQQPLLSNMVKVLVTSNCDTSETTVIPNVAYENGTITVEFEDVSTEDANDMLFLEPSYYEAFWTWAGSFCGSLTSSTLGTPPAIITTIATTESSSSGSTSATEAVGTECQVGSSADPALDCATEGEFCQLDTGVCNNKSGIHYGVCVEIPQACTLEYDPVCGCDEQDYSNACDAHGQGVSVSRMGQCTATTTTSSAATEASASGSTTTAATVSASGTECQVGPSADPTMDCSIDGEFCQLDMGVCNNKSGIHDGVCVTVPQACTLEYDPVCGCDEETYSNACAAYGQGVSVSRMGQCTTTSSVATESSGGTSTVIAATDGEECQVGAAADPALDCATEGEFCQLDTGVCNNKSGIHYGVCVAIPQVCTGDYNPVCGCDEEDYGNACVAHGNGVSVSRLGQCTTSTTTIVPTESSSSGSTTISEVIVTTTGATGTACQVGPSADPTMDCASDGEFCQLETGVCNNKSAIHDGVCVTIPQACTLEYDPVCGCDGLDYGNACAAYGQGVSVSRLGVCTTSTTASVATEASSTSATTVSSKTGATTASITSTTTEFAGVGDFPTGAPTSNSSMTTSKAPVDEAGGTDPGSAARPRSISIRIVSALIAIYVISVLLPGNGASSQYLWGFGKFTVAAVAVTSLYSRQSRSFRNMQNGNQRSNSFSTSKFVRDLQTCSFNVEVLVDGCTKSVAIDAPAARVIDVVIMNQTSELSPNDNCTSSFEANLTFPTTNEITMDLSETDTVEAFDEFDFRCVRAIDGRPFVDASGGGLLAKPCANSDGYDSAALSWIGTSSANIHNITTGYLLGEYWTQRALGEHASVASFSAFSIALMTNQAPSYLVEGALKAGLDEVRHAKTSFEIASILTGKAISPGPLPRSSHDFHHDLISLAMAVAREGCVDETISAFAAAAEAAHITEVVEQRIQGSKYSNVDHVTLTFIRDELIKIAMEESDHSALAWQTLRWACSIDSSTCNAVYNEVFNERILETRFIQRAHNSLGEEFMSQDEIRSEWKKIFYAHRDGVDSESCDDNVIMGVSGSHFGPPLFTSMTDNILRQISHTLVETH